MSNSSPLLTIAMSVFNGGDKLRLAVQSVLDQSFEDWELLIIDDGSTDNTVADLESLRDPRIIVSKDSFNRGLAVRLNQAIDMARGTYFARMDHDDICHPERMAQQISYLQNHPEVDLLAAKCVTIGQDEQILGTHPFALEHAQICRHPWLGFHMPHPTWMGKTSWFQRYRYAQPAAFLCEDQELLLRAHEASIYQTIPAYLLAYRIREEVDLVKLARTRLALFNRQQTHFRRSGKPWFAVMSLGVLLVRLGLDSISGLKRGFELNKSNSKRADLQKVDMSFWIEYLANLTKRQDRFRDG